jgi:hypothetical protein
MVTLGVQLLFWVTLVDPVAKLAARSLDVAWLERATSRCRTAARNCR